MRKLFLGALCLAPALAWGQQSGPGFTANAPGTPISVTSGAGGVSGTLPPGASVVATNIGANTAFCQPGATATTSAQPIGAGAGFQFQIAPATTQLTCITATGTTTVNLVGGSGSAYGAGGGSGSGGGGGGGSGQAPEAATVSASASVTSLPLCVGGGNGCSATSAPTTATGGVKYFHAENATTTGGYCVLYNATAAPGAGALTASLVLAFQLLPASGYCDWTATNAPIAASTGAVVLISSASTPYTYTTGTVTAAIYGLAQ